MLPALAHARRLVGVPPHPEILTELIKESVSVQVNNVAKSGPVLKAWAEGRKYRGCMGTFMSLRRRKPRLEDESDMAK